MKTTEAITGFLRQQYDAHNGKDLLDFYLQYEGALETQVNVAAGNGRPVPGRTSTYADENGNEWWSIRVPKKADSEPEWSDYHLKWPLEMHAEAIGSTGWDWRAKVSRYAGFDFDAIAGHAQGVGVTDETLDKVRQAAQDLPYVTVRRSTGGAGLHLYVFFADGVPTENHTEHAALARAVLGMMSHEAGFNFAAQIDACGGNMWLWHRKSTKENRGLELIKAGEPLTRVPGNWRDHLEVVSRKRAKVRLDGIADSDADNFDRLTSSHPVVPLDEQHLAHIAYLEKAGFCCVWVPDHNLLQTHTVGFKQIADDPEFAIKGVYDTNSSGKDPATPNCFAFAGPDGSWRIYRFSPGIAEAATWNQDGQGLTNCTFNRPATLKTAARSVKAKEIKKGRGFDFETLTDAAKALEAVGITIDVDEPLKDRPTVIETLKDGRLSVQLPKVKPKRGVVGDPDKIGGWSGADSKDKWSQIIDGPPIDDTKANGHAGWSSLPLYEDQIRYLTEDRKPESWQYLNADRQWNRSTESSIITDLRGFGLSSADAATVVNYHHRHDWQLTRTPFSEEYPEPGQRIWNRDGAKFSCKPKPGDCFHWWKILHHVGKYLDEAVANNAWCRHAKIYDGATYLFVWLAVMFRRPRQSLPYLFFWSPEENTGKSALYNAAETLFADISKGILRLDKELRRDDFNGGMRGCVLAYVEELDLSGSYLIRSILKSLIVSNTFKVRGMRFDGENAINYLHFLHTANYLQYAPVYPGDTRMVVVRVASLDNEIPQSKLDEYIRAENSAFLHAMMEYDLPEAEGRLFLPCLSTPDKESLIAERQAEMRDWYAVLREMADEGKIDGLSAKEIWEQLTNLQACNVPKTHQGLPSKLRNAEGQLRKDGFRLTAKGSPAKYTIRPEAAQ